MFTFHARIRCVSRVKLFLKMKETAAAQSHHRSQTDDFADLAKVDLLY